MELQFLLEMIEFGKIFCDLHPNQLVTNYCCREECNIGLCATCICSHTETHIQKNTAPDFENIRTTYSKMQESVRGRISALQHEKSRINTLVENIRNKKKNIQDVIMQARHETLDFVNRFYDAKEKEILRKMEADEKKLGLHNQNRMDTLINLISRDVNTLFAAAQDLNSQNFLQSFHRIRTQVLANSLQTQREVSEQLDKNENYQVSLGINPIYINDVKMGLQKSLNLCWDEKKMGIVESKEPKENSSRTSRLMMANPNENSGITVQKKQAESMPKQSFISTGPLCQPCQPNRSPSGMLEPYASYFVKQISPPPPTIQVQPQAPPFRFQPEVYLSNNSMPIQNHRPSNMNSRIQFRVNSTEKGIKQNGARHPLAQSYMDGSYNNSSQLQASKKIRRSGLTVLRQVDNEKS